jgi:putative membrane protein
MRDQQLIKFLVTALAIFISGMLLPGVDVANVWVAMILAAILSILNRFVKPILVLLTLPATIFSLGLFILVINGTIIFIADWLVPDTYFNVRNFLMGIVFSFMIAITGSVLESTLGINKNKKKES